MGAMDRYWWNEEKKHKAIWEVATWLVKNQQFRTQSNLRHMRLYSNLDILGLSGSKYAQNQSRSIESRLKLNVVQSVIDTVVAKIAKNRPKPSFLTDDGNFSQQQKAKKLEKFVEGVLYETEYYKKAPRAFLDACVFGTGAIKWYLEEGCVKSERVFPNEILIDDAEAVYGKPRQLHQKKLISREVLVNMFPEHEAKILLVNKADEEFLQNDRLVDQVKVIESWHLPSGEDAGDGTHCIVIENETLFEEEWTLDCFPFTFIKWSDRLLGFFGQGVAEQLTGLQLEINKLLRTIQLSMHLCSVPRWMVPSSSKVVSSHINNEVGAIVKYQGAPPEMSNANSVPPELREHLQYLVDKAYEVAGVSQLSAQSIKPAGLNSGVALREYHDIETERFVMAGKAYENMVLDGAKTIIKLLKQVSESDEHPEISVKVETKNAIEHLSWKNVEMDEDHYVMKVFPTSFLPSTPAGRLEKVSELIDRGFITPEDAMDLMDFPDLEGVVSLETAALQDIKMVISEAIEKGNYMPPEEFQNLPLGLRKVQAAYLQAKKDKVPEDRLELLRRWLTQAAALLSSGMQAQLPVPEESLQ